MKTRKGSKSPGRPLDNASTITQPDVIAFLKSKLSDQTNAPKVIETHVSIVFLAGETAYKMKKAVIFPFSDFTTLEARRVACEREIMLNKRTAPAIYKRVVTVTLDQGGIEIDGSGDAVEYLVEMNRFDENNVLDELVTQPEGLRRVPIEKLADEVARFHTDAEIRPDRDWYDGVRMIAENNRQSFEALSRDTLDMAMARDITARTLAHIDNLQSVFKQRGRDEKVRVCHGDLHLRNICLIDDQPTLFDAIEFSDAFSNIDTMYDLAFLLMDLDFRGERRLASFVLNRYLDVMTEGADVFRILPVYLSMRAQIRAHVVTAASEIETARRYLSLSSTYLNDQPAKLVAVGGLSGSGKSRLAREIAPFFARGTGARILRSDVERKRISGVHPNTTLGHEGYTPERTAQTFDHLFQSASEILAVGQNVILDAVFASPSHRQRAEQTAKDMGVEFAGIWVTAPEEIRLGRIKSRVNNVSDITPEIARGQSDYELGELTWQHVNSDGEKTATIAQAREILADAFSQFEPEIPRKGFTTN